MNITDIVILLCFIPAVISGLGKGFVSQIISLVTIVLGCRLAFSLEAAVSSYIQPLIQVSPTTMRIISFIIIFIVVALLLSMIGKLLEKIIHLVMLGWLNRLLGLIFAIMTTGIIIGLVATMLLSINKELGLFNPRILTGSRLLMELKDLSNMVFPYLKELIA